LTSIVVREQLLPKVSRGGFEDDDSDWAMVEAKPLKDRKKSNKK
jgi:hypothetical protein